MVDSEVGVKYYCNDNHALTYFGFLGVEVFFSLEQVCDFNHSVPKEEYVGLLLKEKLSNRKTV